MYYMYHICTMCYMLAMHNMSYMWCICARRWGSRVLFQCWPPPRAVHLCLSISAKATRSVGHADVPNGHGRRCRFDSWLGLDLEPRPAAPVPGGQFGSVLWVGVTAAGAVLCLARDDKPASTHSRYADVLGGAPLEMPPELGMELVRDAQMQWSHTV